MDDVFRAHLRVTAWYRIFKVAEKAADQNSLADLRQALIEAMEAVDEAVKAGER